MGTEGKVARAVAVCGVISMVAYLVGVWARLGRRARLWIGWSSDRRLRKRPPK